MDQDTQKKGKIRLSHLAMLAVRRLRALPKEEAAFTLRIGQEWTSHRMTVIQNGEHKSATYYIYQGQSIPQNYPPESTYLVNSDTDMDTVLAMFADKPELWSLPQDDILDMAEELCPEEELYSEPF